MIFLGPIKNPKIFDKLRNQYERAIQLDPDYAEAYAALAQAYGFITTITGAKIAGRASARR